MRESLKWIVLALAMTSLTLVGCDNDDGAAVAGYNVMFNRLDMRYKRRKAGKKFMEMWAAGREPTSDAAFQPFYIIIMNTSFDAGDADMFEKALGKMREKFGSRDGVERWFDAQEKRLEELKSSAGDEEETGGEDGM